MLPSRELRALQFHIPVELSIRIKADRQLKGETHHSQTFKWRWEHGHDWSTRLPESKFTCVRYIFVDFREQHKRAAFFEGRKYPDSKPTRYTFGFIIADFDQLPAGFDNYAQLRKYLTRAYPGAIVTSSRSDKAKVFFQVQYASTWSSSEPHTIAAALERLIDNPTIFKAVDTQLAAMTVSFITREMLQTIIAQKASLQFKGRVSDIARRPLTPCIDADAIQATHAAPAVINNMFAGKLPPALENLSSHAAFNFNCDAMTRVLLARLETVGQRMRITQSKLAESAGTSIRAANACIKRLLRTGLLQIDSDEISYIAGKQSKSYIWSAALISDCLVPQGLRLHTPGKTWTLPTPPADGEWNKYAWIACQVFRDDPAELVRHLVALPGINDKPDRAMHFVQAILKIRKADAAEISCIVRAELALQTLLADDSLQLCIKELYNAA